jgi:hypothetical protein
MMGTRACLHVWVMVCVSVLLRLSGAAAPTLRVCESE